MIHNYKKILLKQGKDKSSISRYRIFKFDKKFPIFLRIEMEEEALLCS